MEHELKKCLRALQIARVLLREYSPECQNRQVLAAGNSPEWRAYVLAEDRFFAFYNAVIQTALNEENWEAMTFLMEVVDAVNASTTF